MAIKLIVGAEYVKCKAAVENGIEYFFEYFEYMQIECPIKSIEFFVLI